MSRANETDRQAEQPQRPTRAQRLVAIGFLAAFALTIITLLFTGLEVGAPRGARQAPEASPVVTAPSPAAIAPSPGAARNPADASAAEPATAQAKGDNTVDEDADRVRVERAGEPAASPTR